MRTMTDPGVLWLANTLFAIMAGTILAIGAGKLPIQQRAVDPTPCTFATARCSPAGGGAFTDSDGLRQTVDQALWSCYWESRRNSLRDPDISADELNRLYYQCLHGYGVLV